MKLYGIILELYKTTSGLVGNARKIHKITLKHKESTFELFEIISKILVFPSKPRGTISEDHVATSDFQNYTS